MIWAYIRVETPPVEAAFSTGLSLADTVFSVSHAEPDALVSGEVTIIDETDGVIAHDFNNSEADQSGLSLVS